MPQIGLHLGLPYLPTLATNTQSGTLPVNRLADAGVIALVGRDATAQAAYLADFGSIALSGADAKSRIGGKADFGTITLSGFNGSAGGTDYGVIALTGLDAKSKIGGKADFGAIALSGLDGRTKVGIASDSGAIALTGYDARAMVAIGADGGAIVTTGVDAEYEEDYVATYSTNVTVNASSTTSSAFAIAGKIAWIDAPITANARTVTLQTLGADGSSWISTGISWTTSTSVNTAVNSETLAKIAGKCTPDANNFRLSYDSSLTGNTTHIVRSRT